MALARLHHAANAAAMGVRARQFRTGALVLPAHAVPIGSPWCSDWTRLPAPFHLRPGPASRTDIVLRIRRAGRAWIALRTIAATH